LQSLVNRIKMYRGQNKEGNIHEIKKSKA
jgi:hypothetical protein